MWKELRSSGSFWQPGQEGILTSAFTETLPKARAVAGPRDKTGLAQGHIHVQQEEFSTGASESKASPESWGK